MKVERQGLTPKEVLAIQMALSMMIEDVEESSKNPAMPWTPQTRQEMKDILLNAKSAAAKIAVTIGKECFIAPYVEGDEDEFITKQS